MLIKLKQSSAVVIMCALYNYLNNQDIEIVNLFIVFAIMVPIRHLALTSDIGINNYLNPAELSLTSI